MLTTLNAIDAVADYERDGYYVFRQALSPPALAAIEGWLDGACVRARDEKGLEAQFEDAANGEGQPVVRKLRRLFWTDPGFWQPLLEREGVFDIARHLVSSAPMLVFHAAFLKPGVVGSRVAYHQDQALWQYTYPRAANLWLAVTPSTIENGCIRVCRQSHRRGVIPHVQLPDYPYHEAIDLAAAGLESTPIEMQPGDLLLWDRFTVHGSEENNSAQSRKAVVMVFVDGTQADFRATDRFAVPPGGAVGGV